MFQGSGILFRKMGSAGLFRSALPTLTSMTCKTSGVPRQSTSFPFGKLFGAAGATLVAYKMSYPVYNMENNGGAAPASHPRGRLSEPPRDVGPHLRGEIEAVGAATSSAHRSGRRLALYIGATPRQPSADRPRGGAGNKGCVRLPLCPNEHLAAPSLGSAPHDVVLRRRPAPVPF